MCGRIVKVASGTKIRLTKIDRQIQTKFSTEKKKSNNCALHMNVLWCAPAAPHIFQFHLFDCSNVLETLHRNSILQVYYIFTNLELLFEAYHKRYTMSSVCVCVCARFP